MSSTHLKPIIDRPSSESLRQDVENLGANTDHLILERGSFQLFLFRKEQAPTLFLELCRQREITFRLAGQGTGNSFDETPEDSWYDQLLLWDTAKEQVAGAYRLGQAEKVLKEEGFSGLYLTHMFDFDESFFSDKKISLELTRSFVGANYQNDRLALPLLWQGLGLAAGLLGAQRLFGAVTLSSDFTEESRSLMVSWLTRHRTNQPAALAKALNKFPDESATGWVASQNIDELKPQIVDLDGQLKPIPPLLRHYLKLGASFHAFHVEPTFNNAVYCLLEVELSQMPSSHRQRFLIRS